jgi:hypothetical protein
LLAGKVCCVGTPAPAAKVGIELKLSPPSTTFVHPVLVLAVAGVLAGCGATTASDTALTTETPPEILTAARTAAEDAATVHVAGSILGRGSPISVDMRLVSGKGGKGRVRLEGLSIALVNVDDSVYIKSGTAFYGRFAPTGVARLLSGRWLKGSARGVALRAFASLTNLRTLLTTLLSARGALQRGSDTTVSGQPALALRDRALGGTLYIAKQGTPYPLEILTRGGRGKLVLDSWNQPVSLEPPADAINIKQLQGR